MDPDDEEAGTAGEFAGVVFGEVVFGRLRAVDRDDAVGVTGERGGRWVTTVDENRVEGERWDGP